MNRQARSSNAPAQMLGTVRPSPALAAAQRAGAPPSPIVLAMARPIDVDVAGTVTRARRPRRDRRRDRLDLDVPRHLLPGRPTSLYASVAEQLIDPGMARGGTGGIPASMSPAGGRRAQRSRRTTDLSPPPTPLRTPAVTVPTSLDRGDAADAARHGDRPSARSGRSASRVLVPMGIEDVPRVRRDDPRYMSRPQPPLIVGPGQFSDALYVLLERLSGFELVPAEGIVNVAPSRPGAIRGLPHESSDRHVLGEERRRLPRRRRAATADRSAVRAGRLDRRRPGHAEHAGDALADADDAARDPERDCPPARPAHVDVDVRRRRAASPTGS